VLGAAETVVGLTDRFKTMTDLRGLYAPSPPLGRTSAQGSARSTSAPRLVAVRGR
jgi:hypothetical protein